MSDHFVPVALDKQKLLAPAMRLVNADELKCVHRFTGGRTVNLGIYIVAPDGAPLASCGAAFSSADKMMSMLNEAMKKYGPHVPGPLPVRPLNPDRGVGFRADGSSRLALTVRFLDKSFGAGQPVFDSILFTKEHWSALAPPIGATGNYSVPAETARQFARAVSASSDLSFLIRPQDLESISLSGMAVADEDGSIRVQLVGKMTGKRPHVNEPDRPHHGSLAVEGILQLDPERQPRSLLMVGRGEYQQPWMRRPAPTGSLVEWRAD